MEDDQKKALERLLDTIPHIDDSDDGQVCMRVAMRTIVEVLGRPLDEAPLLRERSGQMKPLYCPSQYS